MWTADDEQSCRAGRAVDVFNLPDWNRCCTGYVEEGAANQVGDEDFIFVKLSPVCERDGHDQADERLSRGDRFVLGKVKDDAALVQPVSVKFNFARMWIRFGPRKVWVGDQPEAPALGEFLREVSEDVGEDFAFAALGTADAGQPDPLILWLGLGHRP
jgi:hypothetical protein